MKIEYRVKDTVTGEAWYEEVEAYDRIIAGRIAREIIAEFNRTLKSTEHPRAFVSLKRLPKKKNGKL